MDKKSKRIVGVLLLIILALSGILLQKNITKAPVAPVIKDVGKDTPPPLTITNKTIKEDTFTGSMSVIVGTSVLARTAQAYITDEVAAFKKSADEDVPAMRASFGADAPLSKYTIDIKATPIKSDVTDSIVIDQYMYTGGANGNSSYKVFTASRKTGELLEISDIVIPSKQDAFVATVKKELKAWRPEGTKESVVFAEDVDTLTLSSFANWSYSTKNLMIYFDKYAIGPGALGAIAFPIPLLKVKDFIILK